MIRIAGRQLETSAAFDTYWRFAAERQSIYEQRAAGHPGPWTLDPVLQAHRFTNCYRASDRVSQVLIRDVIYAGSQEPDEIVFRTLLFKFFNRVSTWEVLVARLGTPVAADFDYHEANAVLSEAMEAGQRLYSAAYVMPSPALGEVRKHSNHLKLLQLMMNDELPANLQNCSSLEAAFQALRAYPSLGDFLAFQYLIDINYSDVVDFSEMDFVVAGPGARDGIRKCFGPASAGIEQQVIDYMATTQQDHFDRLGLTFRGLRGRPLQLIDCQNLFCEVDKYSRVAHPEIEGLSGRTRIKQKFATSGAEISAWFPPKWGLNE